MDNKQIITIIAAIVAIIGAIILIAGAAVYFDLWATTYISNAIVTMVAGLIILIIGIVGVYYMKKKEE